MGNINDGKPRNWSFWGGRHNRMSRHRGEYGLWYLYRTYGAGRYKKGWSLYVFSDSTPAPNYAGDIPDIVLNDTLMSHCLLEVSGEGGHDFGKSAGSKGGFRSGGPIPYSLEGKGDFDPSLLEDGDEFLRQVFGYEPTPEGVRRGVAKDKALKEREAAEVEAAKKALEKEQREKREAEEKAHQEAKESFEKLFSEILGDIPLDYKWDITFKGLRIYRNFVQVWCRYEEDIYLESLDGFWSWLKEAKAKLEKEAVEAKKRVEEESKRKSEEAKIAANKAVIENNLDDLTSLLSQI